MKFNDFLRAVENNTVGELITADKVGFIHLLLDKDFYEFRWSAANGHIEALNQIIAHLPEMVNDMLETRDFEAIRMAAVNGHINTMNRLLEVAPANIIPAMVSADEFIIFISVAENGKLDILEKMLEVTPQEIIIKMLQCDNFAMFTAAIANNHFHIIKKLITITPPEILTTMLQRHGFQALRTACLNGKIDIISMLIEITPEKTMLAMLMAEDFFVFIITSLNGKIIVLNKLLEITPREIIANMVQNNYFEAVRVAIQNNHLHIIKKLEEVVDNPNLLSDMLQAKNYAEFRNAAYYGRIDEINFLIEVAEQNNLLGDMLCAESFGAFRIAVERNSISVIDRLLHFEAVFNFAEREQLYRNTAENFMDNLLAHLAHEAPENLIITDNKAKLFFYMMRNLIRRQTPASLLQLNLLLNIPRVQAHDESNELLLLAMSTNNTEAAEILLTYPEVLAEASRHDFYESMRNNSLDLRTLAGNTESSMIALNPSEQTALQRVRAKYISQLTPSEDSILTAFRADLAARYTKNPAYVMTDSGNTIELPLEFELYTTVAQEFSAKTRKLALQSYYQHQVHTSYRYLSTPNHWMSVDANFVYRNGSDAYANFEAHKELIALLYLAATDAAAPAINDYTIESRLDNFIIALALIGRAHNWDNTRHNLLTGQLEEYDDLEGDKPSCGPGVKRRLLQSVQGHSLLTIITNDIIKQEVLSVVRAHFISAINEDNCADLYHAWQSLIAGEDYDAGVFAELNFAEISPVVAHIETNFKNRFGQELDVIAKGFLRDCIIVKQPFNNLVEKFGGAADLLAILEKKQAEIVKKTSRKRIVEFFSPDNTQEEDTSQRKKHR